MDDARQAVNTFDIRMAGHIVKVEEREREKKAGSFHSLALRNSAA